MPIPLPNLDTRRWNDLVDEGRALIPRYARQWTDHNIHDPGITLIELFAWLVEQLIYRANRIPDRHLRKFLALAGVSPLPPIPASVVLSISLTPGAGTHTVPAGALFFAAGDHGTELPFQLVSTVVLVDASLVALQVYDGAAFADRSRGLRDGLPVALFGDNPQLPNPYDSSHAPTCYFGLDAALPPGVQVSLYMQLVGDTPGERARILDEVAEAEAACARPPAKCTPCDSPLADWCTPADVVPRVPDPSTTSVAAALPQHHSVRSVWEYFGADNIWHALDAAAGDVVDETRSLTLGGFVRLRIPLTGAMGPARIGTITGPLFYVRCRLVAGAYDAAPMLAQLHFNAALAEQTEPASQRFVIAAGVVANGAIAEGARLKLDLALDAQGVVQRIGVLGPSAAAPELLVLAFSPATAVADGAITLEMLRVGVGTGFPEQHARLPNAPIARAALSLFTLETGTPATWRSWRSRADLDSSTATDADAVLDAMTGETTFGDAVRGRAPSGSSALLASFASTRAALGNVSAARTWRFPHSPHNSALLGAELATIALATVRNLTSAWGGANAEDLPHAASRAASALWSHERLTELSSAANDTLDQLDHARVLERVAPVRVTTVLDAERIALEIPGTRIRRARAWAGFDPTVPCVDATGTITIIIAPELPRGRPTPSGGLLQAVRRYLGRRRVLCTRLVVVGPEYLDVTVRATVHALASADSERVRRDVVDALVRFLDPLAGGPAGRGWPFGRDVYRSEILQVIDSVPGVDHVLSLELSGGDQDAQCGNLCVPPTWLVASAANDITVIGP